MGAKDFGIRSPDNAVLRVDQDALAIQSSLHQPLDCASVTGEGNRSRGDEVERDPGEGVRLERGRLVESPAEREKKFHAARPAADDDDRGRSPGRRARDESIAPVGPRREESVDGFDGETVLGRARNGLQGGSGSGVERERVEGQGREILEEDPATGEIEAGDWGLDELDIGEFTERAQFDAGCAGGVVPCDEAWEHPRVRCRGSG